MSTSEQHERWMRRALELARLGEGLTRPNPPVGAVLVRDGAVLGEGWHRKAGLPHAEIEAFNSAVPDVRGATLYVTLEPCSSWGRTPPCTAAILERGLAKVVAAVRDPNPRHAGRGLALLRRKGVEVVEGVGGREASVLLAPFAQWIKTGRPYVTLKLGMSLDGKLADKDGQSRWITSPESRKAVHALRRRVDAVLVGVDTVRADDPMLAPRPAQGREPWRVVVDSRGRIPLASRLLNDDLAVRTIVATTNQCDPAMRRQLEDKGAHVLQLPSINGRVSLRSLMDRLGKRGILHVLCEGGGRLAESMVRYRIVDEYRLFLAPRILAGDPSKPAFDGVGWPLAVAPALEFISCERCGPDLMVGARPLRAARR